MKPTHSRPRRRSLRQGIRWKSACRAPRIPRPSRPVLRPDRGTYRPPLFTGRVSSYTLRGTRDSLVRQNARSEEENLERIEDDADLHDRIARGLLVRVPESAGLTVNPALPDDRRYCRPWTADFLTDLARAHQSQFHTPLMVSSAVRTVEYQKQLMRINGNAADAEGDIVSPHLTGATIDIAKSGLSRSEIYWMRNQLLGYQNAGVIDVEEEFHQRCFHITVYRNYDSGSRPARSHQAAGVGAPSESDSQSPSAPPATLQTIDNPRAAASPNPKFHFESASDALQSRRAQILSCAGCGFYFGQGPETRPLESSQPSGLYIGLSTDFFERQIMNDQAMQPTGEVTQGLTHAAGHQRLCGTFENLRRHQGRPQKLVAAVSHHRVERSLSLYRNHDGRLPGRPSTRISKSLHPNLQNA